MAKRLGMNRLVVFVLGVLTGLALGVIAVGVITFGPSPFETGKVTLGTSDVDPAKQLNGNIDPNQRLNDIEGINTPSKSTETSGRPPVKTVDTAASNAPIYWVQAGAFADQSNAEARQADLALNGMQARILNRNNRFVIQAGPFTDRVEAIEKADALKAQGIESQVVTENPSSN